MNTCNGAELGSPVQFKDLKLQRSTSNSQKIPKYVMLDRKVLEYLKYNKPSFQICLMKLVHGIVVTSKNHYV